MCRASGRQPQRLVPGTIVRAEDDDILEGVLLCPERMCRREHPIIDGIAVVVTDIVSWASHQLDAVLRRDDLSPFTESILGDAAGPGSNFDRERTNLSGYGRVHWGDYDPDQPLPREGSLPALLETALALLEDPPRGPWVDLGCAAGRGTFELARTTGDFVAGVDLSFSMLRVAERVRRCRQAVFPIRRVGLVFDRCELAIPEVCREQVSFWCCDVAMLPFEDGVFNGALSLNVLDSVASPLGHLLEMGRVLAARAPALLTTPYDWAPAATAMAQWVGGHSQRSEAHGSSAAELRRILSPDAAAGVDTGLVIHSERDDVPWRVYSNERSSMTYSTHLLRLERKS